MALGTDDGDCDVADWNLLRERYLFPVWTQNISYIIKTVYRLKVINLISIQAPGIRLMPPTKSHGW